MAYLVGLPIVFALIAIEVLVMALKGVRYYKWGDTLGTLGMLAGNIAMGAVVKSLFFGCMVFTYQYRLFDLQADLDPWLHTAGVTSSKLVLPTIFMVINQALRSDSWCFFYARK